MFKLNQLTKRIVLGLSAVGLLVSHQPAFTVSHELTADDASGVFWCMLITAGLACSCGAEGIKITQETHSIPSSNQSSSNAPTEIKTTHVNFGFVVAAALLGILTCKLGRIFTTGYWK